MTKITKPILIGILLSALLFPTATVQAQFTVYDPVANINSLNQLQFMRRVSLINIYMFSIINKASPKLTC